MVLSFNDLFIIYLIDCFLSGSCQFDGVQRERVCHLRGEDQISESDRVLCVQWCFCHLLERSGRARDGTVPHTTTVNISGKIEDALAVLHSNVVLLNLVCLFQLLSSGVFHGSGSCGSSHGKCSFRSAC